MLISKEITCVIDASKRGFIHHASLTILGGIPHDFAYIVKQKGFF